MIQLDLDIESFDFFVDLSVQVLKMFLNFGIIFQLNIFSSKLELQTKTELKGKVTGLGLLSTTTPGHISERINR